MPLQIWAQDAVPQLMAQQGQIIGSGISNFGQSLGRALEKVGEEHKKINTQAKAVETFLKTLPPDQLPVDMRAFGNLSARDKVGVGMGLIQGQQYATGAAKLAAYNTEKANALAAPKFLGEYARLRQGSPGLSEHEITTGEIDPSEYEVTTGQIEPFRAGLDVASAAGQASQTTGYQLPTAALSKILDEDTSGGSSWRPTFTDIPGTDSLLAQVGKSAYPVPKTGGAASSEELFDEQGQSIGHAIRMPGAKPVFRGKTRSGSKVRIPLDPTNPWGGYAEFDPDEYERRYGKIKAGAPDKPGQPPPSNAGIEPPPSDPRQWKVGTTYRTPRGNMTWTGTGWKMAAEATPETPEP